MMWTKRLEFGCLVVEPVQQCPDLIIILMTL